MSKRKDPPPGRLATYRAKRSAQQTPEPFGSAEVARPGLFVVQKHGARRLHYDFRLEWGGTLWSWAVPKGPSLDPAEKRLAVEVEDHPVEYADFEGVIPEGNYGAGAVIVWDRGVWIPWEDPDEGRRTGKLHFELRGFKLRGQWILLRTKGSAKDWLLMKKADEHARAGGEAFDEASILSGLTLEERREGAGSASARAAEVREALRSAGATRRRVHARAVELMHAETADRAFSSPEWIYELKYDGYRMLAERDEAGKAQLRSRKGVDLTEIFPEIARAVEALPCGPLVLDGELCVLDENGRPDFGRLQQRGHLQRRSDIERAIVSLPAQLFVFDLLGFEDLDARPLPLARRKEILRRVVPHAGPLRFADHIEARGVEMFEHARRLGLEGILAKKAASPYRGGRSRSWLKIVVERTADLVVCGFTAPRGSRAGLGALHLAYYENGTLRYAGSVGTGFSDAQLRALRTALEEMRVAQPPCVGSAVPGGAGQFWVRPEWVAEVRFKEWTEDRLLRAPVFVRLREDKRPEECVQAPAEPSEPAPLPAPRPREAEREVKLSNLEKLYWPEDGLTKGDLIRYYEMVSPWLLPYLEDRPLVLTRYPDGIHGKSFYQKNAPEFVPDWIRTETIWSESAQKEIAYFVCNDLETLRYLVNLGTIPLHIWSSRVSSIQRPDWCILDLDPKGAPFSNVVTLARAIRDLCQEIGLPSFVKTTGSTGLHILLPLAGQTTYEQSRMLGLLLARVIESRHPEISTTTRTIAARKGRVYLDYLQNRHGQLLVSPYSVRPFPTAPVSAPLRWEEVNARLTPQRFTVENLAARLERVSEDPLREVLTTRPDLVSALARLAAALEGAESKGKRK